MCASSASSSEPRVLRAVRPRRGEPRRYPRTCCTRCSPSSRSATTCAREIKDLEHAGDEVTHELMRPLNSTFVTPFDREDIYALASGLDDVSTTSRRPATRSCSTGSSVSPSRQGAGRPHLRARWRAAEGDGEPRGPAKASSDTARGASAREPGRPASRHAIGELFSGTTEDTGGDHAEGLLTTSRGCARRCEDVANMLEAIPQECLTGRRPPRGHHRGRRPGRSTSPTASTTPPTRSPPRSPPARCAPYRDRSLGRDH